MRKLLLVALALLLPSVASGAGSAPRLIAKIKVGNAPCAGVAAFGSFWQTSFAAATLSRVNPRTNRVTRTGILGVQPCGIAAGAGSLWIDGYGTSRVERVNPKTLRVVKRIRVGADVWDVAYAFGSVWATNNANGTVSRIDPATNRVVKTIQTGSNPTSSKPTNFAVAKDAIWVGSNSPAEQNVFRIDPATNVSTSVPIGRPKPSGVVVTADALWIASADNTVARLDPATGSTIAVVKVGKQPELGAEARDGTIWVPNLAANTISVIDPSSNTVVRTVKTGDGPFVVRAGFGDMWVGSFRAKDLWRIRP